MRTNYTKADYKILIGLNHYDCTTEFKSYNKEKIALITKLSKSKVYKTLTKFVKEGYAMKGAKNGHQDTFYITKKGIEKLNREVGLNEK